MEISLYSKDIVFLVIDSLKKQKPFFMLRIGDGEMLYFDKNQDRAKTHCKEQLGYLLTEQEIQKIKTDINTSIIFSDVLGLPTAYHEKFNAWRRIIEHYNLLKNQNSDKWKCNKYCSIDIHYELLQDNSYEKILKETNTLFLVSSRDVKDKLKLKFPNIDKIEQYLIPGEQIYEIEKTKSRDFVEQIENIRKIIKSKNRQSQLLLYGAGFVGKIIGYDFSSMGGVALDIGSVFDAWVGKNTRGLEKSANSFTTPLL